LAYQAALTLRARCVSSENRARVKRSSPFFATQATNITQQSSIAIGWLPIISIQTYRWNRFSAAKLIVVGAMGVISSSSPGATPQDFSGRPASAESAAQPIADETRFQR
jgi:hypothetical protein